MTPYQLPTPEPTAATFEERDRERGQQLLDLFISWVNADDEDAIVISRNKGCSMRDEIERLRKVEKELVRA
jgi:hypothetical protein